MRVIWSFFSQCAFGTRGADSIRMPAKRKNGPRILVTVTSMKDVASTEVQEAIQRQVMAMEDLPRGGKNNVVRYSLKSGLTLNIKRISEAEVFLVSKDFE